MIVYRRLYVVLHVRYNSCAFSGSSQLVLRPRSVQEISEIMKYCSAKKLAVVPQSGNTGLVGGSVPVFDEIVVSMQLMNRITHFDNVAGEFKFTS